MKDSFIRKSCLFIVLGCALFSIVVPLGISVFYKNFNYWGSAVVPSHTVSHARSAPTAPVAFPSTTGRSLSRPGFQAGVAFPQWGPTGYGAGDAQWSQGLQQISTQTSARWIEIPLLFFQSSLSSTDVIVGPSTPTLAAFADGLHVAHARGYRIFVTPIISVGGTQSWAGAISFTTYEQEQAWFESYWQAIRPYVLVAAQNGVDQMAIGTEFEWLQRFAPISLWNNLIAQIRSIFPGTLVYDMNWTSMNKPIPTWMHNADLETIGISTYIPLADTPDRVDPQALSEMWRVTVKSALDAFAAQFGKPILLSEIGYRNSSNALYHPWESKRSAAADPEEQAAACNAALVNVMNDPNIVGVFFWGWDNVGAFGLSGLPAVTVIHSWFSSLQA